MRLAALGLTMLLAACGDGAKTSGTSDPAGQNVAAVECANRPDFAPVYGDARITHCTSDGTPPGQQSGTIIYTTAAEPKVVLGWSREQANASGLGQRLLTETIYSAGEATRRNIMVIVEPDGSGSRVTVNWGKP